MDQFAGRRIVAIRPLTADECEAEGWDSSTTLYRFTIMGIELDNGVILYPARDPEGNGPGVLFRRDTDGTHFALYGTDED